MSLRSYLDNLLQDESSTNDVYNFLSRNEDPLEEKELTDLLELCMQNKLRKDIVYICLLTSKNERAIRDFYECERKFVDFRRIDAFDIVGYAFMKREHWFYCVLDNLSLAKEYFSEEIYQKIVLVVLLKYVNLNVFDLKKICDSLEQVTLPCKDDSERFFVDEIRRSVAHLKIIQDLSQSTKYNTQKVLCDSVQYSLLELGTKYLNLRDSTLWSQFLKDLVTNDSLMKTEDSPCQSELFSAFTVVVSVLKSLKFTDEDNTKDDIEKAKTTFFNLNNRQLQFHTFEVIYSLLFTTEKHLKCNDCNETSSDRFICKKTDVEIILQFLKPICDTISEQNIFDSEPKILMSYRQIEQYVNEAIWRFELLDGIKTLSCRDNFQIIQTMGASPEPLVVICMKHGEFVKARKVIERYQLEDTYLAKEINHTLQLKSLREQLRQLYYKSGSENDVSAILQQFLKDYTPIVDEDIESFIRDNIENNQQLTHFSDKNQKFMDLFDIAITEATKHSICRIYMDAAFSNYNLDSNLSTNYSAFCNKIKDLFFLKKNNRLSVAEMLTTTSHPLDIFEYESQEQFYKKLDKLYNTFLKDLNANEDGTLNPNHSAHTTFNKICDLLDAFKETKPEHKYLKKLFQYLKTFSVTLYIGGDNSQIVSQGKNTSYFELLEHNRALIMGHLLFEKKLDPAEFELHFSRMKLDLLYHIAGNCFPTINLHKQENVSNEELYIENQLYEPTPEIIAYIQKRNWLLAFILIDMHKMNVENLDFSEERLKYLSRYLKLPRVQNLKVLFDGNEIITALQNEVSSKKMISYINEKMLKDSLETDCDESNSSDLSAIEVAQEIFEDNIKSTDWLYLYDLIESVPENQLLKNEDYQLLRDLILTNIVTSLSVSNSSYAKYIRYVAEDHLRRAHILLYFRFWPVDFCIDLLKAELSMDDTPSEEYAFENWLEKLQFYASVMDIFQTNNWYEIHSLCSSNSEEVLRNLLLTPKLPNLLQYLELFSPEENLDQIDTNYFSTIFDTEISLSDVEKLLLKLPNQQSTEIAFNLLKILHRIDQIQFIVDYLQRSTCEETETLKNVQMSLKILSCFTQNEQEQLWCLLQDPLSILEVLIMNTKLDKLGIILDAIQDDLVKCENEENCLSRDKLDDLLRNYAEKSLDFRVAIHYEPKVSKIVENKLLQSLDSFTFAGEGKNFVMPANVPTKEEWISNDEVQECMCCVQSTFSMFNRRHHCRRCGRVICYACSQKRMLVPTYGDVLVRVCNSCYEQSTDANSSIKSDTTSIRSNIHEFWLLTDDPRSNKIIREEFSYEHAPSVSLCLAILKHHTKTPEYPKFLLEQCEIMIKYLQPGPEAAQEIDFPLVIKMLKSLAIAAKMLCAECLLHWGTSLADKILSQVDLLSLLVDRGCLHLLPVSSQQGSFVDASNLRRLRDKLLEREQWNLALEVSTKAGLDNTGVFAAWGKSCLKAGCLQIAREKFQRCFDKTAHYDSSDFCVSVDSEDSGARSRQKVSQSSLMENKPSKIPPLLNDILLILQSTTDRISRNVNKKQPEKITNTKSNLNLAASNDPALLILTKLKNLSAVAAGNYETEVETDNKSTRRMDPVFYDECVYYLQKYGTHFSLLEFYVKHGEFEKALKYVLDHRIHADVFLETYLLCLKDEMVSTLQDEMSKVDSTLELWKDYLIPVCRYLEKQNMLHSLYQLQCFMGDYVRAAMTCIRFYKENVSSFTELSGRFHHLQQAEMHLKQDLEQQQWVEVASVRRDSMGSVEEGFEEKALANPSLVLRVDSRAIGRHINTIWREMEIVKFLAQCETAGRVNLKILPDIIPSIDYDVRHSTQQRIIIPTLFDSQDEKLQLAALAIICGENVEEGFGIAYRIIEDNKLKPIKVFCLTGQQLAKAERYPDISQLVRCIQTSGLSPETVTDICDEMLSLAVRTMAKANAVGTEMEALIKLIVDKGLKISAYIETKQLKSAYFLAVKHKRMSDVRRIMREAELLNHPNIKTLCQKILQTHSQTTSGNASQK